MNPSSRPGNDDFFSSLLGPEHPAVGKSINNLAVLHHEQGNYAEAKPLHQRALAIRSCRST